MRLIRKATLKDLSAIRLLFYNTIVAVNSKDYDAAQIDVWSNGFRNIKKWKGRLREQHFVVAEINGIIAGFISITQDGCIDFLFIHKDYQRQGIATVLLQIIERFANNIFLEKIWADVSITAKPFFLKNNFTIIEAHEKMLQGIRFQNTIMTKKLQ